MKHLLLFPILIYRKFFSPAKAAPCCRFSPSCSEYAYRTVSEWGFFVGFFISLWRILRCNPFCRGGDDPVIRRKRKFVPKTELLGKGARKGKQMIKAPYLMLYERYL